MDKKELTVTLTVIMLTAFFAVASAGLFLSKGKSKYWTAKKIKIGAALLTLTSVTQSCNPFRTCYDPVPENYIYLQLNSDTINLNTTNNITGIVENGVSGNYSFNLQNKDSVNMKQIENIAASDGTFDENSEEFTIHLDTNLITGNYSLKLFTVKKEDQNNSNNPINEYNLTFINDK